LDGCETWSITERVKHGLRINEKRVLRRILGLTKDEVFGGWRRLHEYYYYGEQMRNKEMDGSCSMHGRDAYKILVGKREGNNHSEDLITDGRIILEGILEK
jgi:hypothetical protein